MQTTFKNINMSVCIFAYILPNGKETGEIFMKVGECGDKKGNGAHGKKTAELTRRKKGVSLRGAQRRERGGEQVGTRQNIMSRGKP